MANLRRVVSFWMWCNKACQNSLWHQHVHHYVNQLLFFTIWRVLSLYSLKDKVSMMSINCLKCGLVFSTLCFSDELRSREMGALSVLNAASHEGSKFMSTLCFLFLILWIIWYEKFFLLIFTFTQSWYYQLLLINLLPSGIFLSSVFQHSVFCSCKNLFFL